MREIGAANLVEVTASSLEEILMVRITHEEIVRVHSGVGIIEWNGEEYLGIGILGSISQIRETAEAQPTPLRFSMSGIPSTLLARALDAGTFGDEIIVYVGYKGADGLLVGAPVELWRGTYEFAEIQQGRSNVIEISAQSVFAALGIPHGSRFTEEEQRRRDSADTFFKFIDEVPKQDMIWGESRLGNSRRRGGGRRRDGGYHIK